MFSLGRLFRRERRIYPRVQVGCDVMFGTAEPFTVSTVVDLSFSGIAVRSMQNLPPGTKIEVRLMPEGPLSENWIELEGVVRRSEANVLAVEFTGVGGSERKALGQILPEEAAHPV
jgi:hypothetical protein